MTVSARSKARLPGYPDTPEERTVDVMMDAGKMDVARDDGNLKEGVRGHNVFSTSLFMEAVT
jgi:hypothetical protein